MAMNFYVTDLLGQSGRLADPIALLVLTQQCWLQAVASELGDGPAGGIFLVAFGLLIQTSAWLDFSGATG